MGLQPLWLLIRPLLRWLVPDGHAQDSWRHLAEWLVDFGWIALGAPSFGSVILNPVFSPPGRCVRWLFFLSLEIARAFFAHKCVAEPDFP